jgi:hypothetical protein
MENLRPRERDLSRETTALCRKLLPRHAAQPEFHKLIDFVLSSIRGLSLLNTIQPSGRGAASRWPYARAQLLQVLDGKD